METLLKPDIGLMVWTIVSFILLVFLLGKFAWEPLLNSLRQREERIKNSIETAESTKVAVEKLREEYEQKLKEIENKTRELILQAEKDGGRSKDEIIKKAKEDAKDILEKTKAQLGQEKDKIIGELRGEVGRFSVLLAEKILKETVDKKIQERLIKEFLEEIETKKPQ